MLIGDKAGLNYIRRILEADSQGKVSYADRIEWMLLSMAKNRYGGAIAGSAFFMVKKDAISKTNDDPYEITSGFIHLLPPPTKISTEQAINNILKEIKGVTLSQVQPSWVNSIPVPGEKEIESEIRNKVLSLSAINEQKDELNKQLETLISYKDLLFQMGTPLGYAVKRAFEKMGFSISDYEKVKGKEDFILETSKGNAIVEVTGIANKSVSLADLRQLAHFVDDMIVDGSPMKGIFIGNPSLFKKA